MAAMHEDFIMPIAQPASPRRRVTWAKLGERIRLMLQRLNDGILLREDDLCALVCPDPVSRQARAERFTRWQADQYLQAVPDATGPCYQLGRRGALLPAFFSTVETLSLGTGKLWHPWNPRRLLPDGRTVWVWHDMEGRPRSLRPWDLEEERWRFEQPETVRMRSLQECSEV